MLWRWNGIHRVSILKLGFPYLKGSDKESLAYVLNLVGHVAALLELGISPRMSSSHPPHAVFLRSLANWVSVCWKEGSGLISSIRCSHEGQLQYLWSFSCAGYVSFSGVKFHIFDHRYYAQWGSMTFALAQQIAPPDVQRISVDPSWL